MLCPSFRISTHLLNTTQHILERQLIGFQPNQSSGLSHISSPDHQSFSVSTVPVSNTINIMSGMETMEDLTLCHLSQMNQEIQEFVAKEVHVLKERAKGTSERAKGHVRKLSRIIMNTAWDVCHFKSQPQWMQDNDFLHFGHRPQLPSFKACLMSIFRLHTETGNIWTHLIGCIFFLGLSLYLYLFSPYTLNFEDKIVFGIYFLAVTVCLFFSTVFHTFSCHSHEVGKICCK